MNTTAENLKTILHDCSCHSMHSNHEEMTHNRNIVHYSTELYQPPGKVWWTPEPLKWGSGISWVIPIDMNVCNDSVDIR